MKKLMQKLGYLFLVVLTVAMSLSGCLTAVAHADDGVDAQAAITMDAQTGANPVPEEC